MDDFSARSWGGLGRSWRSFCLIFLPSFLTSIFHRFFFDFGGVLGGFWEAKTVQNRYFECFGEDFFRYLIFDRFSHFFWDIDFGWFLEGFWEGFGRPKSSIFTLLSMFFRTHF